MPSRAKKCSMMFPKPTPHLEDHPSEWLTTLMIVSPVRLCFPPSKWVFCMAYIQGLHPNNFICVPRKLETWLHLWQNMSKSKWKTSSWGKPQSSKQPPDFFGSPMSAPVHGCFKQRHTAGGILKVTTKVLGETHGHHPWNPEETHGKNWWFYSLIPINVGEITPKNEGNVGSHGRQWKIFTLGPGSKPSSFPQIWRGYLYWFADLHGFSENPFLKESVYRI